MATRSIVQLCVDAMVVKTLYHHWDGYPENMLRIFESAARILGGYSEEERRNPDVLFGALQDADSDSGFEDEGVGSPHDFTHSDIEWYYEVSLLPTEITGGSEKIYVVVREHNLRDPEYGNYSGYNRLPMVSTENYDIPDFATEQGNRYTDALGDEWDEDEDAIMTRFESLLGGMPTRLRAKLSRIAHRIISDHTFDQDPQFAEEIGEIMFRYDEYRDKWVEEYGTEDGYDDWFTQQVMGSRRTRRAEAPQYTVQVLDDDRGALMSQDDAQALADYLQAGEAGDEDGWKYVAEPDIIDSSLYRVMIYDETGFQVAPLGKDVSRELFGKKKRIV